MRNLLVGFGVAGVIILGGWWYFSSPQAEVSGAVESGQEEQQSPPAMQLEEGNTMILHEQGAAIGDENLASFTCDGGKTITAVFERDIVGITLSDGRQLVLRQAPSGSGIRYLSNDTKIEFRGKGNEGSLIEEGITTYDGCEAK